MGESWLGNQEDPSNGLVWLHSWVYEILIPNYFSALIRKFKNKFQLTWHVSNQQMVKVVPDMYYLASELAFVAEW